MLAFVLMTNIIKICLFSSNIFSSLHMRLQKKYSLTLQKKFHANMFKANFTLYPTPI